MHNGSSGKREFVELLAGDYLHPAEERLQDQLDPI